MSILEFTIFQNEVDFFLSEILKVSLSLFTPPPSFECQRTYHPIYGESKHLQQPLQHLIHHLPTRNEAEAVEATPPPTETIPLALAATAEEATLAQAAIAAAAAGTDRLEGTRRSVTLPTHSLTAWTSSPVICG
jgi:hypothetical protein